MKGAQFFAEASIAELYADFAHETADSSPTWHRLCAWISGDRDMQQWLDLLPSHRRQPNLFLAALRFHEAPIEPGPALLSWLDRHREQMVHTITARETQTNEPGRCAVLAPAIASLADRIALIEVGMSAGLNLIPDRYGYRWLDTAGATVAEAGPQHLTTLECVTSTGPRVPLAVPEVVWRAGIDLNPLNSSDPEDRRWLRALVWPDQPEREQRLTAALDELANHDIVRVRGDANAELAALVRQAPADTTVVVMHTAVMAYLPEPARIQFEHLVQSLGVHWISNEGATVMPSLRHRIPDYAGPPAFVLAIDGQPIARTGPHGQFVDWIPAEG